MKRIVSLTLSLGVLLAAFFAMSFSVNALPDAVETITYPKLGKGYEIVIDGKVDPAEGWGEPLVTIDSTNIQTYSTKPEVTEWDTESIKGYYRWDEECFYFACEVVDPEHFNNYFEGGAAWQGDSIRFDISHDIEGDQAALNRTMKYWFYMNYGEGVDGETVGLFQELVEDGCKPHGANAAKDFAVTRDEETKTTTYELAMYWHTNLPDDIYVEEGLQLITHQRVMERSSEEDAPQGSISLPGFDTESRASKWHYVTLGAAIDGEMEETQAPTEATEATEPTEATEAPTTDVRYSPDSTVILIAVVAVVCVAVVVVVVVLKKKK